VFPTIAISNLALSVAVITPAVLPIASAAAIVVLAPVEDVITTSDALGVLPKFVAPPPEEAIVICVALFLVNVTPVPSVKVTKELSLPEPDVKFKGTLLPDLVPAFKS
jgi:hypothetical protein